MKNIGLELDLLYDSNKLDSSLKEAMKNLDILFWELDEYFISFNLYNWCKTEDGYIDTELQRILFLINNWFFIAKNIEILSISEENIKMKSYLPYTQFAFTIRDCLNIISKFIDNKNVELGSQDDLLKRFLNKDKWKKVGIKKSPFIEEGPDHITMRKLNKILHRNWKSSNGEHLATNIDIINKSIQKEIINIFKDGLKMIDKYLTLVLILKGWAGCHEMMVEIDYDESAPENLIEYIRPNIIDSLKRNFDKPFLEQMIIKNTLKKDIRNHFKIHQ